MATKSVKGPGTEILEGALALNMHVGCITTRRHFDPSQVEVDADRGELLMTKRILQCDEFDAIKHLDRVTKTWLLRRSLQSPLREGIYLIPVVLVKEIDAELERYRKDRLKLVNAFCAVYPERVKAAKKPLRKLYDEADYPTVARVRAAFSVTTSYFSLSVPGSLKAVNLGVFHKEQARAEQLWGEAAADIRAALLQSMKVIVDKMIVRLSETDDGKRRQVKEAGMARAQEFFDLFEARNLMKHEDLNALAAKARAVLKGVNAETLRENDNVRATVAKQFQALDTALGKLIVTAPGRRVVLRDDDAA